MIVSSERDINEDKGEWFEVPEEENRLFGINVQRRLWSKLNHIIYDTKTSQRKDRTKNNDENNEIK